MCHVFFAVYSLCIPPLPPYNTKKIRGVDEQKHCFLWHYSATNMQADDRLTALCDQVYDAFALANTALTRASSAAHVSVEPVIALVSLLRLVTTATSAAQLQATHNIDAVALRRALWRAIALTDPDTLARVHLGVLPGKERICLGELAALAALRLALLIWDDTSAAATATASTLWMPDADVSAQTPVAQYSTLTLMRALQVLREEFTRCTLSNELVQYCEALEARAAALLFFTWPDAVHDSLDLCVPTDETNDQRTPMMFRANAALLEIVWCSFSGIYRRVLHGAALMSMGEAWPISDPEQRGLARLHDWFLRKAGEMMADESSMVLKRIYPRLQLRPGDIELFRLRHHGIMPDIAGVLQEVCEMGRMADIMRESELPISVVLQRVLPAVRPGEPEDPLASLAMYDLLDVVTRESGSAAFGLAFAAPETKVLDDPDSVHRLSYSVPMVLQVFNHWQFARNGTLYMLNSFLRALYAWLSAVHDIQEERRGAELTGDVVDLVHQQTSAYFELQALVRDSDDDDGNTDANNVAQNGNSAAASAAAVVVEFA